MRERRKKEKQMSNEFVLINNNNNKKNNRNPCKDVSSSLAFDKEFMNSDNNFTLNDDCHDDCHDDEEELDFDLQNNEYYNNEAEGDDEVPDKSTITMEGTGPEQSPTTTTTNTINNITKKGISSPPPPKRQRQQQQRRPQRPRSNLSIGGSTRSRNSSTSGLASMEGNDGIHSFSMYLATKSDVHCCISCGGLFLSWFIVTIQIIIFGFIIGESSKAHCTTNNDCQQTGQICSITGDGFCEMDFNYGNNNNNNNDINDVGEDDELTFNCPFLEENQPDHWSTRIVMIFIFFYVVSFTIDDMDQSSRIYRASTYRLDHHNNDETQQQQQQQQGRQQQGISRLLPKPRRVSPPPRTNRKWIAFNIWSMYYIRTYLLPCVAFQASIAIVYAESPVSAQSVILNGLAVGFICSFDDALHAVLIPPGIQIQSALAMSRANEKSILGLCHTSNTNDFDRQEFRVWMKDRIMCLIYVILCLWIMFHPNKAILLSPSTIPQKNTSLGNEFASCDDFVHGISSWPVTILLVFTALDKLIIGRAPTTIIIRDFFLGPLFVFIYWNVVLFAMLMIYIFL